jgi:putative ABC transport system permease protein
MARLTANHIDYIKQDLTYRGVVVEGIQEELIDHICDAVEAEMAKDVRFIEAYHGVLVSFGHTSGLRKIQWQSLQSKNQKTAFMLKNYFTIAVRNLKKHRFYTFINITGLAIGIASCIIIVLFVLNELSYDRFHQDANRIYRVNTEIKFGGNHFMLASGSSPLAELLNQTYPEVESTVRLRSWGPRLVKSEQHAQSFKEPNVIWSDSTFFKIFSIPVIEGDPKTALTQPNTVAISKKIAAKYFPAGNAVGQMLIFPDNWTHKVTAVFDDMPSNSHFHFDILVAMTGLDEAKSESLIGGGDFNTYLLLKEGVDAETLEAKFVSIVEERIAPQIANVMGGDFTLEKFHAMGSKWEYTLTPLLDIHLYSDLLNELAPNGNITYVYIFSAIALFILGIACINFMNLSTARSASRAKEVGIRKVMGSLRWHLVRQFLMESILLSIISFMLAIAAVYLILPVFNDLAEKKLVLPLRDPLFYTTLLVASVLVGVMAGFYPSFFLSAFKPVHVLKGQVSRGMKSGVIRSAMVVFQFVISIFLIIGTLTVNRQLSYIQSKKIGFEKDQVFIVHDAALLGSNIEAFREQMIRNNFIIDGTISGYFPVAGSWRGGDTFFKEGLQPSQESLEDMVNMQAWFIDVNYVSTMRMKIKSGRNFSDRFPSDSSAMIINEAAAKRFGFEDPVGKKISTFGGNKPDGTPDQNRIKTWMVIGVVEDFHFESLRENIGPLAFFLDNRRRGSVAFRFNYGNTQDVVETTEKQWKALAPGQPFQYTFLDDDFGRMYASERRLGEIFGIFAGLAIAIACLGLFALTAFTTEQRTKEIGIRKVLGASVSGIVVLLSKQFGKLILIAFIIAAPLTWLDAEWWLKNYSYKVEIGVGMYLLAGAFAFLTAWLTMGYQSIKAAKSNPVNSLRSE